jgi:tetratricopeptide (TPR) repeat protein
MACEVEALRREIVEARERQDEAGLLAALGRAGDLCRILGELDQAISTLEEAVELARSEADEPRLVANLIRLGTAFQYGDDHASAERFLREALSLAESGRHRAYEGFACQHLGKCLAELGRYDDARGYLARALAIRESAGDEKLIASTHRALEALAAIR